MIDPGTLTGRHRRHVRRGAPLLAVAAVLAVVGGLGWSLPGSALSTSAASTSAVSRAPSSTPQTPTTPWAGEAEAPSLGPIPGTKLPVAVAPAPSTPAAAPLTTADASTAPQTDPAPPTDIAPAPAPAPAPAAPAPAPAAGTPAQGVEGQVVALVNQQRAAAGCPAVSADEPLARVARAHSADMRDRGYFSHTSPEGLSPFDRAAAAGVPGSRAENIAMGQPDAAAVMAAWMASPGHRTNILDCGLTRLGVGVAQGPGGPWWTQLFGS